jgi:hypothetical protein
VFDVFLLLKERKTLFSGKKKRNNSAKISKQKVKGKTEKFHKYQNLQHIREL